MSNEELPDDVIEDLMETKQEVEERIRPRGKQKLNLPSTRDIANAVIEAAYKARGLNPEEFPELVKEILENNGFNTRYVNDKRIWRTYETLVRRGVIPDTLGVVIW